jgi:predicted DsbA family dithiol-disulfide isomerase
MLLEIVSDLVCPWCYIGKRHLDAALTILRNEDPEISIDVHLRAFQLDPTAPLGSTQPVREAYARRFGGEASADGIIDRVTRVAREAGINFAMDQAIRANTAPAHRLLKHVGRTEPRHQLAVNESVMSAYFSEGRDISNVATLEECATRAGFVDPNLSDRITSDDPSDPLSLAVAADLEWCRDRDVSSVPTFVINDTFQIPGAQEPATLVRLIRKLSPGV